MILDEEDFGIGDYEITSLAVNRIDYELSSRLINIPCLLVCLWTKISIALNQSENCLLTPSLDVDSASSAWNLRPHLLKQSFICPANFDSSWIPEGLGHSTHRNATLLQMNTITITLLQTDLHIIDRRDSGVLNYLHRLLRLSRGMIFALWLGGYLTIGSCFSVHYRVMEHVGSLESTKEA